MSNETKTSSTGPLAGLRIFDMTQVAAGPWVSVLLGGLGATVFRIEPPGEKWSGDMSARILPTKDGLGTTWLTCNMFKQSVALNFKEPADAEIGHRLAATCDLFVENMRKGVAARLGFGYEALSAANPGHLLRLDQRLWAGRAVGRSGRDRPADPGLLRLGQPQRSARQRRRDASQLRPPGPHLGYVRHHRGAAFARAKAADRHGRSLEHPDVPRGVGQPDRPVCPSTSRPVSTRHRRAPRPRDMRPTRHFVARTAGSSPCPWRTMRSGATSVRAIGLDDLQTRFPTNASRLECRAELAGELREVFLTSRCDGGSFG